MCVCVFSLCLCLSFDPLHGFSIGRYACLFFMCASRFLCQSQLIFSLSLSLFFFFRFLSFFLSVFLSPSVYMIMRVCVHRTISLVLVFFVHSSGPSPHRESDSASYTEGGGARPRELRRQEWCSLHQKWCERCTSQGTTIHCVLLET